MIKPTIAQKWARLRNWDKARLMGSRAQIGNITTYTGEESAAAREAINALDKILLGWRSHNEKSKREFITRRTK